MLNDTDELPPGTVTDGGGLSAPELLLKATDTPLPGAAPCSCTMPEVGTPPVIGLKTLTDWSEGGFTVKVTDFELPLLSVPVRVTGVFAALTWPTVKKTCPNANPAGMVNVAGSGAAVGLLLVRLTTVPPDGAGPVNWT